MEERIEQLVQFLDARLTAPQAKTRKRLAVILEECGYQNRTAERLRRIEATLEQHGIFCHPSITDPELDLHRSIQISRFASSDEEPGLSFPDERALQEFLFHNYSRLSAFKGLKSPRKEFLLPSGRRIDLLFRERQTNAYVPVELKAGNGGFGVGMQLLAYIDELRRMPEVQAKGLERGIVVTGLRNPIWEHEVLQHGASHGVRVDWYCYAASLELTAVAGPLVEQLGDVGAPANLAAPTAWGR